MARPPVRAVQTRAATLAPTAPELNGRDRSLLASLLSERRREVLDAWVRAQDKKLESRSGQTSEADVRAECTALLDAL